MPAYVIADTIIENPVLWDEYKRQVPATVERYGGRFAVRGGRFDVLEGTPGFHRIVMLEFPDMDAARRWYASPEYAPLIELRQRAGKAHLTLVEGI